jgi:hypothetical protein
MPVTPDATLAAAPQATPAAEACVETLTLAAALAAIRADCLAQPLVYLDEVQVPFGGE